jgi:hypothetical protein
MGKPDQEQVRGPPHSIWGRTVEKGPAYAGHLSTPSSSTCGNKMILVPFSEQTCGKHPAPVITEQLSKATHPATAATYNSPGRKSWGRTEKRLRPLGDLGFHHSAIIRIAPAISVNPSNSSDTGVPCSGECRADTLVRCLRFTDSWKCTAVVSQANQNRQTPAPAGRRNSSQALASRNGKRACIYLNSPYFCLDFHARSELIL